MEERNVPHGAAYESRGSNSMIPDEGSLRIFVFVLSSNPLIRRGKRERRAIVTKLKGILLYIFRLFINFTTYFTTFIKMAIEAFFIYFLIL